jgi:hypothetical protein
MFAYLDPGTGSMVAGMVAAGAAGAGVAARSVISKLRFKGRKSQDEQPSGPVDAPAVEDQQA